MVRGETQRAANFRTKIDIQIRQTEVGKGSELFVWALPSSDGIDASSGASIWRDFHLQVDGAIEASVVRNILAYVAQISITNDRANNRTSRTELDPKSDQPEPEAANRSLN